MIETYYHLALNKMVRGVEVFDPPGLMTLAPDRLHWLAPDSTPYLDISASIQPATLPNSNNINALCVWRFLFERLSNSEAFKEIHTGADGVFRLYEDLRVPPPETRKYPYCALTVQPYKPRLFTGEPEIIGDAVARVLIQSIWNFPSGNATRFSFIQHWVSNSTERQANPDYDPNQTVERIIREACCGICGYPVRLDGVMIGYIEQSSFTRPIESESGDGTNKSVHTGCEILVQFQ